MRRFGVRRPALLWLWEALVGVEGLASQKLGDALSGKSMLWERLMYHLGGNISLLRQVVGLGQRLVCRVDEDTRLLSVLLVGARSTKCSRASGCGLSG